MNKNAPIYVSWIISPQPERLSTKLGDSNSTGREPGFQPRMPLPAVPMNLAFSGPNFLSNVRERCNFPLSLGLSELLQHGLLHESVNKSTCPRPSPTHISHLPPLLRNPAKKPKSLQASQTQQGEGCFFLDLDLDLSFRSCSVNCATEVTA